MCPLLCLIGACVEERWKNTVWTCWSVFCQSPGMPRLKVLMTAVRQRRKTWHLVQTEGNVWVRQWEETGGNVGVAEGKKNRGCSTIVVFFKIKSSKVISENSTLIVSFPLKWLSPSRRCNSWPWQSIPACQRWLQPLWHHQMVNLEASSWAFWLL